MAKNIVKVAVVLVLCAALGGIGYLLYQQSNPKVPAEGEMMPTATVSKGTVVKQVKGTGEVKAAQVEKLKMPKWRYFKDSDVPLNKVIPAGTVLANFTYGDPLVAPYDLVVLSKSFPKAKEELTEEHYVEVARVNAMHGEFDVHESVRAQLSEGQAAQVVLGFNRGKTFEGKVTNINQVGTYNSTGSKYKATIEIPNDGSILIGMTANVRIDVAQATDVLTVPVSAIVDAGAGKTTVLVQRDGELMEPVEVETGLSDGKIVEVKSGLKEGDKVALNEPSSQGGAFPGEEAAGAMMITAEG